MLSSTSLLHGNCIFNRNNTVATQQGMKTYWLCKSYRLTMCRARCITHRGTVISATGVHNHQPHMKGTFPNGEFIQSGNTTANSSPTENVSIAMRLPPGIPNATVTGTTANNPNQASALEQPQTQSHHRQHQAHDDILPSVRQHQDATQPLHDSQDNQQTLSNIHHSPNPQHGEQQQQQQHTAIHHTANNNNNHSNNNSNHSNAVSIQMMQNVLSHSNLMNLSNMPPILNPMQSHLSHLSHLNSAHSHSHSTDELHVVTSQHDTNTTHSMNSPSSPRNAQLNRHHMSNADLNRLSSLQPPNNMHSNHPHEHVHSPVENQSQHQTQAAESNSVERHSIISSDPYKLEAM